MIALKYTHSFNGLALFMKSIFLGLILSLGACATENGLRAEQIRAGENYVESFADVNVGTIAQDAYKNVFKVGDTADVNVFNVENLSDTYVVDGAGNISFPLIGTIRVVGLSTTQLQQTLTDRYGAQYLQNPSINVKLDSKDLGRIVVDGSVNQPGVFEIKDVIRLTEAIALAEGLDEIESDGSLVYITRTINGQRKVSEADLREIRKFAAIDPQIIPDDVIFVQDKAGRIAFREFLRAVPLLNPVVLLATR